MGWTGFQGCLACPRPRKTLVVEPRKKPGCRDFWAGLRSPGNNTPFVAGPNCSPFGKTSYAPFPSLQQMLSVRRSTFILPYSKTREKRVTNWDLKLPSAVPNLCKRYTLCGKELGELSLPSLWRLIHGTGRVLFSLLSWARLLYADKSSFRVNKSFAEVRKPDLFLTYMLLHWHKQVQTSANAIHSQYSYCRGNWVVIWLVHCWESCSGLMIKCLFFCS